MVVKQMQIGSFAVFAYLVGSKATGEALVIDPAGDQERIVQEAEKKGLRITTIVNTHSHVDHVMGNKRMKELTGAQIVIHEAEAANLGDQPAYLMDMFGAESSPAADRTVRENDVITVGDVSLRVIHTPGHSPGSICLHTDGLVFTGDTLFVSGVGRTDLQGGSWQTLVSSIRTKLFVLPDDTMVLPGHNYGETPKSTIGMEKVHNPYVGSRARKQGLAPFSLRPLSGFMPDDGRDGGHVGRREVASCGSPEIDQEAAHDCPRSGGGFGQGVRPRGGDKGPGAGEDTCRHDRRHERGKPDRRPVRGQPGQLSA
jgi:glyoxylase-like metal-dependent hydrolase (beta-lactamase superfamily II)